MRYCPHISAVKAVSRHEAEVNATRSAGNSLVLTLGLQTAHRFCGGRAAHLYCFFYPYGAYSSVPLWRHYQRLVKLKSFISKPEGPLVNADIFQLMTTTIFMPVILRLMPVNWPSRWTTDWQ